MSSPPISRGPGPDRPALPYRVDLRLRSRGKTAAVCPRLVTVDRELRAGRGQRRQVDVLGRLCAGDAVTASASTTSRMKFASMNVATDGGHELDTVGVDDPDLVFAREEGRDADIREPRPTDDAIRSELVLAHPAPEGEALVRRAP